MDACRQSIASPPPIHQDRAEELDNASDLKDNNVRKHHIFLPHPSLIPPELVEVTCCISTHHFRPISKGQT